jgi:hypothetical protein
MVNGYAIEIDFMCTLILPRTFGGGALPSDCWPTPPSPTEPSPPSPLRLRPLRSRSRALVLPLRSPSLRY